MISPANPNRPARAELTMAGGNPFAVKGHILNRPRTLIPIPFIDGHHAAPLTSETVIREVIGRVSENHIDGVVGDRIGDLLQNVEAITLE